MTENHKIKKLGAWDTAEVIRISPQHGYYSHDQQLTFIPVKKNRYHSHQTFEIKRKSGRYNPNQIKETVKTLPSDVIPADFFEYQESIFFKFALPTAPSMRPIPYDYR
jgi:hypothetical protein